MKKSNYHYKRTPYPVILKLGDNNSSKSSIRKISYSNSTYYLLSRLYYHIRIWYPIRTNTRHSSDQLNAILDRISCTFLASSELSLNFKCFFQELTSCWCFYLNQDTMTHFIHSCIKKSLLTGISPDSFNRWDTQE